jgi:hypothetical protein
MLHVFPAGRLEAHLITRCHLQSERVSDPAGNFASDNGLLAPGIERREIAAVQGHELRRQPAMAIDPGADFMRIEPH